MKSININVGEEIYKIIQLTPTINLYKILHLGELFEVTRNNYNGTWKILIQNNEAATLPLRTIGQAIEENFNMAYQKSTQVTR